MRKARIAVLGTTGKVIEFDPDATRGATLGTNVFLPDGSVGTPATVQAWLGLVPNPRSPPTGSGTVHHRLLQGLTLGDDHPQYTQWVQDEDITGQWDFFNQTRFQDGTAPLPALAFIEDPNTGIYRLGANNFGFATDGTAQWDISTVRVQQSLPLIVNVAAPSAVGDVIMMQVNARNAAAGVASGFEFLIENEITPTNDDRGLQFGIWENGVNSGTYDRQYPPAVAGYGYRWRLLGSIDSAGDLVFYSHDADAAGQEIYRHWRDSHQMGFSDGSAAEPTICFANFRGAGFFRSSNNIGFSARLWAQDGNAAAPSYSFNAGADTDTGMYREAANVLGFSTGGTLRLSVGNADSSGAGAGANGIRSTLSFRGPDGSATVPAFTFTGDDDTGAFLSAANTLGFSAGGTLRVSISTAALITTLPISAPDGSAGAPSYAFTNDLDCGVFRIGTDSFGFATAATERLRFSADGAWGLAGANYGTTGQVLKSNGSGAAPTWQDIGGGTGTVDTIVAGNGITVDATDPANPVVSVDTSDAFTWTGAHVFTITPSVEQGSPSYRFVETDQAANEQRWRTNVINKIWRLSAVLDDNTNPHDVIKATRGTLNAISSIDIGNTTDEAPILLAGVVRALTTIELGHASDTTLSRSAAGVLDVEGHSVTTDDQAQTISGAWNFTTAPQIASIELGHASDTTLARGAAGELDIEGDRAWNQGNVGTQINALTEDASPSSANDYIVTYDASAGAGKKVLIANLPAGTVSGDPYWAQVIALLHFDGADAGTTFTDQKGNAWTATNNAQLDTAQFKFGTASLLLDGTNDNITTPDAPRWTLADNDFTIECFVRFNSTASDQIFVSHYNATSNQRGWQFGFLTAGSLRFLYSTNGTATASITESWSPSTGVWYHVAVARNGADLRLFVDGTQLGSTHNIGVLSIFNSTAACVVGEDAGGLQDFNGWIDELRITLGVARYTANFTAPTAAFPDGGIGA